MDNRHKINWLFQLEEAAALKQSCKNWDGNHCLPAAVLMNMPGKKLLSLFRQGLYVHESKPRRDAVAIHKE